MNDNYDRQSKEKGRLLDMERLVKISEEFLQINESGIDYQKITKDFLEICKAKYAVFNLLDEDGKSLTTMAISGDKGMIKKASDILGFEIEGKKWAYDPVGAEKIKYSTITRFQCLRELIGDVIPKSLVVYLENTFNIGEVILIKILRNNVMIGDLILIMEKGERFEKDDVAEIYTRQLGMFITRKRAEAALRQEKIFTDALLESIPGYLYVYDESGRLIRWNKKHEEITGYTAEELSQMTLHQWFEGEDAIRVAAAVEEVFRTGYGNVEAQLLVKGGGKLHILSNGIRLRVAGKNYFTGVGINITQRKQAEEALKESENKFRSFVENSNAIIYSTTDEGIFTYVSPNWENLLGHDICELEGKSFSDFVPEEDIDLCFKFAQKVLCSTEKVSETVEYRVRHKDGSLRWHASSGSRVEKDGKYIFLGVARDITEQKKLETALANEKKLLETTLISVGDGVISTDNEGNIVFLNRVAEDLTGWTQESARGKPVEEVFNIISEFTRQKSENIVKKVLENGKILELANHTLLISKDGTERPIEDSAAPILQENGEIIGVVLVFRDFSEKKQRREEILYLSYHDQLTGLYNRRFYEEELKRLDTERNLPMTIVMGDVNGLKLVNDSFGHALGDELLKKAAQVIRKGCRRDDIIARIGGDEFVILLPKTDVVEAEQIIKRIKERALKEKVDSVALSISFGYETKYNEEENIKETLKNAEDYMYRNKLYESMSIKNKTIDLIMNTLYEKSHREMLHSKRVSEICEAIATKMGFDKDAINQIKTAGLMHDIGKMGVDEKILNKTQGLNNDEWKEVKRHPEIGYRILSSSNEFSEMAKYVLEHHERWDGKGYPKGLKGKDISVQARIIAVADAYDAMTRDRSYRKGLSEEQGIAEIKKSSPYQLDPEIARVFVEKVLGNKW